MPPARVGCGYRNVRETAYSYTVDRVGLDSTQRARLPLIIAIVELEEGPRMTTNLIGCAPEAVSVGQAVEATFEDLGKETLVHFQPIAS